MICDRMGGLSFSLVPCLQATMKLSMNALCFCFACLDTLFTCCFCLTPFLFFSFHSRSPVIGSVRFGSVVRPSCLGRAGWFGSVGTRRVGFLRRSVHQRRVAMIRSFRLHHGALAKMARAPSPIRPSVHGGTSETWCRGRPPFLLAMAWPDAQPCHCLGSVPARVPLTRSIDRSIDRDCVVSCAHTHSWATAQVSMQTDDGGDWRRGSCLDRTEAEWSGRSGVVCGDEAGGFVPGSNKVEYFIRPCLLLFLCLCHCSSRLPTCVYCFIFFLFLFVFHVFTQARLPIGRSIGRSIVVGRFVGRVASSVGVGVLSVGVGVCWVRFVVRSSIRQGVSGRVGVVLELIAVTSWTRDAMWARHWTRCGIVRASVATLRWLVSVEIPLPLLCLLSLFCPGLFCILFFCFFLPAVHDCDRMGGYINGGMLSLSLSLFLSCSMFYNLQ